MSFPHSCLDRLLLHGLFLQKFLITEEVDLDEHSSIKKHFMNTKLLSMTVKK